MEIKKEIIPFCTVEKENTEIPVNVKKNLDPGKRFLSVTALAAAGRFEALEREVNGEGHVTFCVTLALEDGTIESLPVTEHFSLSAAFPGATPQSRVLARAFASQVEGKLENGWLMLSCVVCSECTVITEREKEFVTDLEGENVRKKLGSVKLQRCCFALPLRFTQHCSTTLSPRLPQAVRALDPTVSVSVRQAAVDVGRLVIAGDFLFRTAYLSDDEYQPVVQICDHGDFSFVTEVPEAGDSVPMVTLSADEVTVSVLPDEKGELRILEYQVVLSGYAYQTESFSKDLLLDAYSVAEKISVSCGTESVQAERVCRAGTSSVRFDVTVPEDRPGIARIGAVFFSPGLFLVSNEGGRAHLSGRAMVSVLYTGVGTEKEEGFETSVPIEFRADGASFDTSARLFAVTEVNNVDFSPISQRALEIRAELSVCFCEKTEEETRSVTELTGEKTEPSPFGIVLYRARPGDTLWEIGKRFGVDEEDLLKLNPGLKDGIEKDQAICVFRKLSV